MNRFILRYPYPITAAILAILAWAAYRQWSMGGSGFTTYVAVAVIVWFLGTVVFVYYWPAITYSAFKRAALKHGLGGGPIPINTLYAVPNRVSPAASDASLLATGTEDVVYIGGVLDLAGGPLVLHVPEMADRYYSVQLTNPTDGTNFAYVGTRTTGTAAGDYLISGPGWTGSVLQGMKPIPSPNKSVLVIGRVFVASEGDRPTAYGLSKQIQVTPLSPR
ncbi:MAG TPA: DUF1254 domain-containing protein [Candidatus Dormibacteraeota bacterium]|nr:DUF1254 domain-containing protein [Candidatus Dormibacteraeota bacterium]